MPFQGAIAWLHSVFDAVSLVFCVFSRGSATYIVSMCVSVMV